ncbi:MAG: efflux RND transporter permease subunit [Proteobacteria bacterium]|nr:efflux RND transporter permease subunit [Pseudomonadota bacterium]
MSDRGKTWEEALPRFSLKRRITVLVLGMTALVVGVVASIGIPLELIPRGFEQPSLYVSVPWRDSPPKEVLDKVILPLEEELSTVGGLDQVNTYARTGRGLVFLNFKSGTDMDVAYREVRDRILRARARMPSDIDQIRIHKENESDIPVMVIGVAVDPTVPDPYNLIMQEIIRPFERIDGVATVRSDGLQEKEVLIELDRGKTSAAGLNAYLVARELSSDNFSLASGTIRHGDKKLLLRSIARYQDLDVLRDQLVSPTVRLSDIADVRYDVPERYWYARVNGKPALGIEILKEGQANTIEVGDRLQEAYEEIRADPRLQGTLTAVLMAQRDLILESLSTLLDSGQVGAIFAVLVLLFFLRRFRLTLIITLSIPLSMILALTAMYFAGETLNILTLLGLIISVGLLVDNSVVVAENIHRLYQEGVARKRACIQGAGEIALAVVLATLTTIIVFLPVSLVEGRAQFFLMRLALPISVSLAASLVVALVVVPLSVYLTLGRRMAAGTPTPGAEEQSPPRRSLVGAVHSVMDRALGGVYAATLGRLARVYSRLLWFFLRHRLDLALILFVLFAMTMAITLESIKVVEISREDRRSFRIRVDLPANFQKDDTAEFFISVEKVLEDVKDELALDGYLVVYTVRWGRINAWFPDQKELSPRQVTERVMEILPKKPGVKYYSGSEDDTKSSDKVSEYSVIANGDDPELLADLARSFEEMVVKVDGVLGVKRSRDMSPNELALLVDRDRAQHQGISPRVIAGVVASGLRGQPLPRYHRDGKEIPVRLRFAEEDRESLAELADFAVPTASGDFVQLSSVTDVSFLAASRSIYRRGKRVSHSLTVDLVEGKERETKKRLDALFRTIDLPEGVRFGTHSDQNRLDDDVAAMQFAAVVSVIFIYFLMGFLFESFLLPLSVIVAIPMASIGVAWIHFITGRDLDFLGFVGVILLIGVVVNNGIVLVDTIHRLRSEGQERTKAVLLAAARRFRPIMMTAGTTICGMIPLTLGAPTSIGLSYKSFGFTLISGMITSTALTLLVVPVLYTVLDDARQSVLDSLRRALRRRT